MKPKMIFATGNADKMKEIRQVFADLDMEILSMKEAGITADIVEDGTTFIANARIKARAIHQITKELVLADDSGLEVDAMDGAPGVYSARFLGEDTSYDIKNQAILDRLAGVEGKARSARFRCAIAAVFPDGHEEAVEGTIEGVIGPKPSGNGGFGYDPIFYLPDGSRSTADLTADEKNAISHRGQALRKMRPLIEEWLAKQV